MWITESLLENDRRGYQKVCSHCKAYGLKGSDCIFNMFLEFQFTVSLGPSS